MDAKTIAVALRLDAAQFTAGLGMAGGRVKAFANDVSSSTAKVGKGFQDAANASDQHLKTIGNVGLIAGGAVVAGFGLAVAAAFSFDKQMSEVGAVAGATGGQLGDLRQAALDAGQATVFSASQAAQAESELAKAGVSTADILAGGLTGALNLASAGSLDLGTAAGIAANAMTTFGMKGSDVPHIADVLAAAANKSATDVSGLALALSQAGLVAAQSGISFEETAGTLAMFAQNGLKGSDAGTSLKTMLQALTGNSQQATDAMKQTGLSFYDSAGNFIGLDKAAQQLQDHLGSLSVQQQSTALKTIFGSDAVRSAYILMKEGATGVDGWTEAVNASGYAADLAAQKNNNLAGDLEQLKGSFETALIQQGSKATGVLRDIAQWANNAVNGLSSFEGPAASAAGGLVAVAGGGALTIGVAGTMIPKFKAIQSSLNEMGTAGKFASSAIGPVGVGLAGAMVGLALAASFLGSTAAAASRSMAEMTKGFKPTTNDMGGMNDQVLALTDRMLELDKSIPKDGFSQRLSRVGEFFNPFDSDKVSKAIDTYNLAQKEVDKLQDRMNATHSAAQQLSSTLGITYAEALKLATKAGVDLGTGLESNVPAVQALYAQLQASPPVVAGMAGSLAGLADKSKTAQEKMQSLTDAVKSFLGLAFGEEAANDTLTRKMIDLQSAAEGGQLAFEGNSGAALDFREKMRDVTSSAGDLINEWVNTGIQGDELKTKVYLLSQSLVEQAVKFGVPRQAAEEYFGKLAQLPPEVFTNIWTPGLPGAKADVGNLNTLLAITALGAVGIVATPGADGSIVLTDILKNNLGTVAAGASGPVSVPGSDGATYLVSLVNGQLTEVKKGANAAVTADTSQATQAVSDLAAKFAGISIAHVEVQFRGSVPSANGNIFEAYVDGGIRAAEYFANGSENHVAQIASAGGGVRVWAEPETQGEGYIPFAPSKRPRSVAILGNIANRFGYGLTDGTDSGGGGTTVIHEGDTINLPITQPAASPYEISRKLTFDRLARGR
jgi:TP901 family phage tail tape measure protein